MALSDSSLTPTEGSRNWIDGRWFDVGAISASHDPATGEIIGCFADSGEAEARAAVTAARRVFATTAWSRDRTLRSRALLELANGVEERAEELALMLTRENGKTLIESRMEVAGAIATLRHNASQVRSTAPYPSRSASPRSSCPGIRPLPCSRVLSARRWRPATLS